NEATDLCESISPSFAERRAASRGNPTRARVARVDRGGPPDRFRYRPIARARPLTLRSETLNTKKLLNAGNVGTELAEAKSRLHSGRHCPPKACSRWATWSSISERDPDSIRVRENRDPSQSVARGCHDRMGIGWFWMVRNRTEWSVVDGAN